MQPAEAKRVLKEELSWPDWMIDLGLRANFQCEYCDKYMLGSVDIYDGWQVDHIIPNDDNDMGNLALACRTCNFIKRHSVPFSHTEGMGRDSLVAAAKEMVSERRLVKEDTFRKTRTAVEAILKGNGE